MCRKFMALAAILSLPLFSPGQKAASISNSIFLPAPAGFTKLKEADGDLDKDGIPEHIVVFDTKKETDFGTERQLYIYKKQGQRWKLWHKSTGVVLPSEHGGSIGDPFEGIEVQRGCLVIYHFGGTTSRWTYTHRYRFQHNNWYLIGATINVTNPNCHYDYNLSTGNINADVCLDWKRDANAVGDDSFNCYSISFKYLPGNVILMDGFEPGEHEVKIPGKDDSFYF